MLIPMIKRTVKNLYSLKYYQRHSGLSLDDKVVFTIDKLVKKSNEFDGINQIEID